MDSHRTLGHAAEATGRRRVIAELLICLAAGAIASVLLGQDVNWDLRNYHLYNPFALLNGRTGIDLMPAGMQSNFNPLLDVPYYVLAMGPLAEAPRVLAALAGLPYGALLFATLRLAAWMLGDPGGPERLLPWIAVAIAGSAAATKSEIGTTFNDIQVATLLLGGLVLGCRGGGDRPIFACMLGAGAMVGTAVALKPTVAVFAPGVVAALLIVAVGWRARLRALAGFAAGALPAAALLAGPWALMLLHRYGSPTFPLMNGLFRSDWYPPDNIADTRFLPRDIGQTLFYPFYWLRRNASLVSEPPFRDARMALAMLALPLLGFAAWRGALAQPRRVLAVAAMAATGYVAWLRAFSILRYAIVLEALAALLFVAALQAAARSLAPRRRLLAPGAAVLALAVLLWHTESPVWWRIPYGKRVFEVEHLQLPPDSLVLTMHAPVAMAVPFLDAPGFRAVGLVYEMLLSKGYRLFAEMVRRIQTHDGPVFALADTTERALEMAPWFGLVADPATCRPFRNNITYNAQIMFCPLHRKAATATAP
jgi:hypothetical protein